jgi:hypothetical protein
MARDVHPLQPEEIPELSRFLVEGFRVPRNADFAAPDVLRWKYFDPCGGSAAPRSYIAREQGRLVGHVGICFSAFRGDAIPGGSVATLHMIDWLSADPGAGIGTALMFRANRDTPTQFGLGMTESGRRMAEKIGRLVTTVPVFQAVLGWDYRLRAAGPGGAGRVARWGRDLARGAIARLRRRAPRAHVELRPVRRFGPEVLPILDAYQAHAVLTDRRPERLNHLLDYPRPGLSGWLLACDGRTRGFALLSVVRHGAVRTGKLVDCVLDDRDPDRWHAALTALTCQLRLQGADAAVGFGSTAWMARALEDCGYRALHRVGLYLRDKQGLIPRDAAFHLTHLEADAAYT